MRLGLKELEIKPDIYITKRRLRRVSAEHYRFLAGHAYVNVYVVKGINAGKSLTVVM